MAQIGTFTLKDDVWSGTLRTLRAGAPSGHGAISNDEKQNS